MPAWICVDRHDFTPSATQLEGALGKIAASVRGWMNGERRWDGVMHVGLESHKEFEHEWSARIPGDDPSQSVWVTLVLSVPYNDDAAKDREERASEPARAAQALEARAADIAKALTKNAFRKVEL